MESLNASLLQCTDPALYSSKLEAYYRAIADRKIVIPNSHPMTHRRMCLQCSRPSLS